MSSSVDPPPRGHRSLGQQLNRSPRVLHASWLAGLAILLAGVRSLNDFSVPGLVFLAVLFFPIVLAYRRDRLSWLIIFATFFLPAWPLALYKAVSRAPVADSH